ncbi:MAG: hypothetical protein LUE99_11340 [Bacteroides sp.]|nr:hypothetical protein [Bacteroides sp.]
MKNALLFLLSISISVTIQSRDFYFKHLGISDGLSQTSILSIYQDEIGAMWFGSSEGLNRYNGKEIKIYQPSQDREGLTNNEITELCGDKDGHIYIRSGNDLVVFDIFKEQFTCLRKDDIRGLFCKDKTLWVICGDAIYTYLPEKKTFQLFASLPSGLGEGRAVYVDDKHVWAITYNHLMKFDLEKKEPSETILKFEKGGRCISKDRSGNLWVGTWNGLYRVSPEGNIRHFTDQKGKEGLSDNQVRCVLEDSIGHLWIGTFRGWTVTTPSTTNGAIISTRIIPPAASATTPYMLFAKTAITTSG